MDTRTCTSTPRRHRCAGAERIAPIRLGIAAPGRARGVQRAARRGGGARMTGRTHTVDRADSEEDAPPSEQSQHATLLSRL
jgi:hypothetical protein